MAFTSAFFDAELVGGEYDRVYSADKFAEYFASFISNGVFPDPSTNLQVVANTVNDMNVLVSPGMGWINGYYCKNDGSYSLAVQAASGTLNRIDAVVIGWSRTNREITTYIKTGIASSSPTAPSLARNSDLYELMLATITINAGVTKVTQSMITDKRPDSSVCGWVTGVVQQIDTTDLFAQYDDAFQTWFDDLQTKLSGDVATSLQNQINQLSIKVDENFEKTLSTETKTLFGLNADSIPDDAFRLVASGIPGTSPDGKIYVMPLLSKLNHVEAGPLDEFESNHIGAYEYTGGELYGGNHTDISDRSPSDIYWSFMGGSSTSTQPKTEFLSGRYSYNFTRTQAYKLDHMTRTATLLADLSGYIGSVTPTYDRIFAVDDQYIYFAKHLANSFSGSNPKIYGTTYKFDHSGKLISSYTASGLDWMFDPGSGWSGSTDTVGSCFEKWFVNYAYLRGILHTKNYIVLFGIDGNRSTSNTYKYWISVISKTSMKVVSSQYSVFLTKDAYVMVDYDNDILFFSNSDKHIKIQKLTESGVTDIINTADCYIKFGGKNYHFSEIARICNHSGKSYFKITFTGSNNSTYYTVITANEFHNLASATGYDLSDYVTINYIRTESISFDLQNYDPAKDEFTTGGVTYDVYPSYIAANNPKSIASGYGQLPYFKVDDHYYFLRTYDNEIYESDASLPIYKADRFLGVS